MPEQTHEWRCFNFKCRVQVFIGFHLMPFNYCPVCQEVGTPVQPSIPVTPTGSET